MENSTTESTVFIRSAQSLARKTKGQGVVHEHVYDLLNIVEEDINTAIEHNLQSSLTELPVYFDIPGMTNKRAKKYIYFHLLKALEKAGYSPKLKFNGNNPENVKAFVKVQWLSSEDLAMEDYMSNFINKHIDKPPVKQKSKSVISRRRRK